MACWPFGTQKDGISALALQRALGIGSYQTAWAMLHRLRSVLVRPGRELLQGRVEVDETYIGGEEPGLRGSRAKGKKALVGIAVERIEPRGLGRCRMAWLRNASGGSLRRFLIDHVEPGATVISDGWKPYIAATEDLYVHERVVVPGAKASDLMPGMHRVAGVGQALAAWHPSGRGRRAAPLQLYRRVRLSLQPPALAQPRDGLLPRARARGRARPRPLPRSDPQPAPQHHPPRRAHDPRTAPEPGPAGRRPALEERPAPNSA